MLLKVANTVFVYHAFLSILLALIALPFAIVYLIVIAITYFSLSRFSVVVTTDSFEINVPKLIWVHKIIVPFSQVNRLYITTFSSDRWVGTRSLYLELNEAFIAEQHLDKYNHGQPERYGFFYHLVCIPNLKKETITDFLSLIRNSPKFTTSIEDTGMMPPAIIREKMSFFKYMRPFFYFLLIVTILEYLHGLL